MRNESTASGAHHSPVRTKLLGGTLVTLFLANLINFFDRAVPSVVAEPIKQEFALSDTELGFIAAAFTLVYAVVGIPLGRLADRHDRPRIIAASLLL